MDPEQTVSAFQIQVYKMPSDLNISVLFPPVNWNISGTLNPSYQCGQPLRVDSTVFPDPTGLDSDGLALASWQVVCDISRPKGSSPKCCASLPDLRYRSRYTANQGGGGGRLNIADDEMAPRFCLPSHARMKRNFTLLKMKGDNNKRDGE